MLKRLTILTFLAVFPGAALADDLRAPELVDGMRSGWVCLPAYDAPQALPAGARPLADHVQAPPVLARRLSQPWVRGATRARC